jgi:hypothetical protein
MDIEQNAIIDDAGYLFQGGKWKVFIKYFQDMYDIDILAEMTDRPFDLIGLGKKMDDKIKMVTESGSSIIGKADNTSVVQIKLKDVSSSVMRR